jgi:drug/metabolite transporter (DMT)-like permease
MSIKNVKEARKGLGFGLLAGATWGVDTVLVGIVMAMTPFIDTERAMILAPFVSTFLHDFFSAVWATIYMIIKGEFKNVLKTAKTKGGRFVMLAALLGGPVGMTCYLLSIKYIGAAYTASITAIFPGVGAFLAFVFLKEKMNKRVWSGIALSIVGVITLGYMPAELSSGSNFLLGILFALGTVFAWSIEGVICAYSMKYGEVDAEHAINIRQATSGLFYAAIIIPLISGYDLAFSAATSKVGLLIAITALVGTTSYIQYYKAISMIGAARSTALNITYGVWAIILQIIFFKTPVSLQLAAGAVIVLIGSMLVAGNPKELIDFSDEEVKLVTN